jgi:hypothetical protein
MGGHVLKSQQWLRMLWSVVASLFAGVIVGESTQNDEQREAAKAELRQLIDSHARPKMVDVSGDEPLAINITEPPDTEAFRQSLNRATFTNGKSEHSQVRAVARPSEGGAISEPAFSLYRTCILYSRLTIECSMCECAGHQHVRRHQQSHDGQSPQGRSDRLSSRIK